jgi:hypothetical protein
VIFPRINSPWTSVNWRSSKQDQNEIKWEKEILTSQAGDDFKKSSTQLNLDLMPHDRFSNGMKLHDRQKNYADNGERERWMIRASFVTCVENYVDTNEV